MEFGIPFVTNLETTASLDKGWRSYKILYSDNMAIDLFNCNEHSSGVQLRFRIPFLFYCLIKCLLCAVIHANGNKCHIDWIHKTFPINNITRSFCSVQCSSPYIVSGEFHVKPIEPASSIHSWAENDPYFSQVPGIVWTNPTTILAGSVILEQFIRQWRFSQKERQPCARMVFCYNTFF